MNNREEQRIIEAINRMRPKTTPKKESKWVSRKLFVMVIGGILASVNDHFQIMPPEDLQKLMMLMMSYIVGQSGVDMIGKK